jgi:RNA 3'-terminal phosphate cyclase
MQLAVAGRAAAIRVVVAGGELTGRAGQTGDAVGAGSARDALLDRQSQGVTDSMTLDVRSLLLARARPDESLTREHLLHQFLLIRELA